jgi:hypothetical protein
MLMAYLRASARHDVGAALGRLLNATDGLLAQSTPTIILLTTNEPLARLHPAITRPGRCLSSIEFTRFDRHEAATWLGESDVRAETGATLAELFEWRRTGSKPHPELLTGTYL